MTRFEYLLLGSLALAVLWFFVEAYRTKRARARDAADYRRARAREHKL